MSEKPLPSAAASATLLLALLAGLAQADSIRAADPLSSWNNTAPKKAIVAFVEKVTKPGGPDFVQIPERIAVFDNDGTLWSEQPIYTQFQFVMDRVKVLARTHPEWKEQEPFATALKGDLDAATALGVKGMLELTAVIHAGLTTDEFALIIKDWLATARHPTTGRPYTEMVYQPMLELLAYLRAKGFKTFIVSGGSVEFMRPWTEKVYGIPPEQVIGSTTKTKRAMRDGTPVIVRLPEIEFVDDRDGKPIGIFGHIGRRPIAAFGNSDGDLEMLQWTAAGRGARLCLYVHHTDARREWEYDRKSNVGRLDKGLDEALTRGWTIVNMKEDWKTIFHFH